MHTALAHLSDAELLRHAENSYDDLTSTVLEIELTERFKNLLDESAEYFPMHEALRDNDIDSVEELQKVIDASVALDELREEATELADRLNHLVGVV